MSAQQVAFCAMQKGALDEEAGMQHFTTFLTVRCTVTTYDLRWRRSDLHSGSKHSQLIPRAPKSCVLAGRTHATPAETL